MRDILLVDRHPARVRLFREAAALCDDLSPLWRRAQDTRAESVRLRRKAFEARMRARVQIERARHASRDPEAMQEAEVLAPPAPLPRRGRPLQLHVFPAAEEALRFLRREAPYGWAPRPAVVFTDLHLDGKGTLLVAQIKTDPALREIPTIALSAGASAAEVRAAWEAGSNAVLDLATSPKDGFVQVRDTLRFWLAEAMLEGDGIH